MGFFKGLFRQKNQGNKISFIEAPNFSDRATDHPFRVIEEPDINDLFARDDPHCPFPPEAESPEKWKGRDAQSKRHFLAMAYLAHPNPKYRLKTIEALGRYDTLDVIGLGVDLLADEDESVALASAKALIRADQCRKAVLILRDEIQGHSVQFGGLFATENLRLGKEKAKRALTVLVDAAPSDTTKKRDRRDHSQRNCSGG